MKYISLLSSDLEGPTQVQMLCGDGVLPGSPLDLMAQEILERMQLLHEQGEVACDPDKGGDAMVVLEQKADVIEVGIYACPQLADEEDRFSPAQALMLAALQQDIELS